MIVERGYFVSCMKISLVKKSVNGANNGMGVINYVGPFCLVIEEGRPTASVRNGCGFWYCIYLYTKHVN